MTSARRTGRPAGGSDNRDRILAAAREEFADHGFRGTSLRAIAQHAGVDVALISHYFGSKDGLFAETMELPSRAREILLATLRTGPGTPAERLVRGFLSLWESPETGPQMHLLARSALGNETAGARLRELMTGTLTENEIAPLIAGREVDFALAMSSVMGISINRYLNGHPGLTGLDFEELVRRVVPAVSVYLD